MSIQTCPRCHGTGTLIRTSDEKHVECNVCRGMGWYYQSIALDSQEMEDARRHTFEYPCPHCGMRPSDQPKTREERMRDAESDLCGDDEL